MNYRIKYFLDQPTTPHYRIFHALDESTAKEMLKAGLAESGYAVDIVDVQEYKPVRHERENTSEGQFTN